MWFKHGEVVERRFPNTACGIVCQFHAFAMLVPSMYMHSYSAMNSSISHVQTISYLLSLHRHPLLQDLWSGAPLISGHAQHAWTRTGKPGISSLVLPPAKPLATHPQSLSMVVWWRLKGGESPGNFLKRESSKGRVWYKLRESKQVRRGGLRRKKLPGPLRHSKMKVFIFFNSWENIFWEQLFFQRWEGKVTPEESFLGWNCVSFLNKLGQHVLACVTMQLENNGQPQQHPSTPQKMKPSNADTFPSTHPFSQPPCMTEYGLPGREHLKEWLRFLLYRWGHQMGWGRRWRRLLYFQALHSSSGSSFLAKGRTPAGTLQSLHSAQSFLRLVPKLIFMTCHSSKGTAAFHRWASPR